MWAVPCAALLVVAGGIDIQGTVISETRAGEMPFQAGDAPRPFVATLVSPVAELELRRPDLEIRLGYGPRLFWQDPTIQSAPSRPLLLHMANFTATTRPSSRATLTVQAAGTAGEADYSLLPRVFGSAQSALPGVTKILTGTGTAQLRVRAMRRWQLALGTKVEYRGPLGDATTVMPPASGSGAPLIFPRQTLALAEPSAEYRLSRRDDLTFTTSLSYGSFSNGVEIVSVTPRMGWRVRTAPHSQLTLELGVSGGRDIGGSSVISPFVAPVGSAQFDAGGLRPRGVPVHVTALVSADYVVDPILMVASPRGMVSGRLSMVPAADWSLGAEAMFSTSLRASAIRGEPDETAVSLSLPVRRRVSAYLFAELGGRATDRAPSFAASHFGFHQRQVWVYLMLVATSRGAGPWAAP